MFENKGDIMASFAEIEKENDPKTTIIKYAQELHKKPEGMLLFIILDG